MIKIENIKMVFHIRKFLLQHIIYYTEMCIDIILKDDEHVRMCVYIYV